MNALAVCAESVDWMVRIGVKGTWARRIRFGLAGVSTMVGMAFVVAGLVFTKKAGFRQCSGVVYEGVDVGMEGNAASSTGSTSAMPSAVERYDP